MCTEQFSSDDGVHCRFWSLSDCTTDKHNAPLHCQSSSAHFDELLSFTIHTFPSVYPSAKLFTLCDSVTVFEVVWPALPYRHSLATFVIGTTQVSLLCFGSLSKPATSECLQIARSDCPNGDTLWPIHKQRPLRWHWLAEGEKDWRGRKNEHRYLLTVTHWRLAPSCSSILAVSVSSSVMPLQRQRPPYRLLSIDSTLKLANSWQKKTVLLEMRKRKRERDRSKWQSADGWDGRDCWGLHCLPPSNCISNQRASAC